MQKLVGAAAAAQIALLPFAGSALAQPQFDLAVDLPNPLALAKDAKGKADSALPNLSSDSPKIDLPGPAPSIGDAVAAFKDVAGGGGGLKEAARGKGANISATRATGDLSEVGDLGNNAKEATPSNGNAAGKTDPVGDRQAVVDDMNTPGGPDEAKQGGGSGRPRAAVGDLAVGEPDKVASKTPPTGSPAAGNVDLPGPAPSLGETISTIKDVASGGGDLKEAARGGGRNISTTRATGAIGDLSLGDVGNADSKAKDAAASPNAGVGDVLGKVKAAAPDTAGKAVEKAKDGAPRPDISNVLDKASANLPSVGAGGVNLPGPAPSLEDTQNSIKAVASGGGGLKAAVASKGANISRTGDAMAEGLKPGQYQPS